jgi:hypothetical protein
LTGITTTTIAATRIKLSTPFSDYPTNEIKMAHHPNEPLVSIVDIAARCENITTFVEMF